MATQNNGESLASKKLYCSLHWDYDGRRWKLKNYNVRFPIFLGNTGI